MMTNEEKILAMLEKMDSRLDQLEQGQIRLEAKMDESFADLKTELNYAWQDISNAEDAVKKHEVEFHSA